MAAAGNHLPLPSFEELVELAQANPEAFSILKKDICEEAIMSASSNMQDRLWALQSHIDRVIGNCKNPNHINARLMKELANQVIRFQETLNGDYSQPPTNSAQIIPFPGAVKKA